MTTPETGATAAEPDHSQTLPCGEVTDELLEQVAEGHADDRSEHQRGCVHCQSSLAEFQMLWEPVVSAAGDAVAIPPGLSASIKSAVQRRIRDVWFTFEATDGGAIRVAARIVGVLARDTARRVPGVRVVLGRSSESKMAAIAEKATLGHRHPHSAVGVLGRTAAVDLAVAVTYGDPAPDVARQIQLDVITALRNGIGLTGIQVNIAVDDVLPPTA